MSASINALYFIIFISLNYHVGYQIGYMRFTLLLKHAGIIMREVVGSENQTHMKKKMPAKVVMMAV